MGVGVCCLKREHGETEHKPLTSSSFVNYPKSYAARRGTPPVIDGDIYKAAWESTPWSEPFAEIRGHQDAPSGTEPTPQQTTRMKMLWDDEFLYIAALLDVAKGDELIAKFTERNSPIFHTDSDFEVFIDPAGCCHGYKELEMNAINTVWNLMLNRPYSDGGGEISARVAKEGEPNFWDVRNQRTAVRILRGALNDVAQPAQWCCEIALAHSDNLASTPVCGPTPVVGASWRINFSRVEMQGNVNWVWCPQIVWSPKTKRLEGQVNMHLPDAWGYVVFADDGGRLADGSDATAWLDPAFPARNAATCMYYGAQAFFKEHQHYPDSVDALRASGMMDGCKAIGSENSTPLELSITSQTNSFQAVASANGWHVTVQQDRLIEIRRC